MKTAVFLAALFSYGAYSNALPAPSEQTEADAYAAGLGDCLAVAEGLAPAAWELAGPEKAPLETGGEETVCKDYIAEVLCGCDAAADSGLCGPCDEESLELAWRIRALMP